MIGRYKMKTGKFFGDFKLGWRMFTRGKLKLFPSGVRKKREIADLFRGLKK
jgi:hypothetical protein